MDTIKNALKRLLRGLPEPVQGLILIMRPHQWVKNGFVFAGILFDQQLDNVDSLLRVSAAFVLLCMTASTIYVVNDLVDIERDRAHPLKRNRPLPSGQLPVSWARIAAIILPTVALVLSIPLGIEFVAVQLVYLALHIAYSFYLKNIVLIDVFAVAAGYVLRVVAGVAVIDVTNFSPWLYVCAGLLTLFLAIGKRRQELILLSDGAADVRATYKQYNLALLDEMLRLVTTGAVITYMLYTIEAETRRTAGYQMLFTIPIVLYGVFRYLYLVHVRGVGGAPDELIFEDMPLLAAIMLWVFTAFLILYVF